MLGPDSKILDDLARVAGGAVNIVSGLQQQIREDMRSRMDDMASKMDLVPRQDFDHACALISELLGKVEALEGRIAALEKPAAKKTTNSAKKTPLKKTKAAKKK